MSWADKLRERDDLIDQANSVPGDGDDHDEQVAAFGDSAALIEREIWDAPSTEPFALAAQFGLAMNLWAEGAPPTPEACDLLMRAATSASLDVAEGFRDAMRVEA